MKGSWKVKDAEYHGREYKPVAYEIARVTSDAKGRISTSFTVPEDFGFSHDIVLQQGDRLFTQVGFSIDMTVKISPESGAGRHTDPCRGQRHRLAAVVQFMGAALRQQFHRLDVGGDHWRLGELHDSRPPAARACICIEVLHGEFTFPYRNMQQNPEPDRPRWAIPFTITAGPPVLPPPPDQQAQTHVRMLPPQGRLVATPAFSGINEPLLVRGEGFAPGENLKLNWSRVVGNRMTGRGWQEATDVVAESKADASGRAEFRFNVPDDLGGSHTLSVESTRGTQTGTFWIKPTALPMDVTRGPVGHHVPASSEGRGLERNRQHRARRLRQQLRRLCLRVQQPG